MISIHGFIRCFLARCASALPSSSAASCADDGAPHRFDRRVVASVLARSLGTLALSSLLA
jgi:hypothetical protein